MYGTECTVCFGRSPWSHAKGKRATAAMGMMAAMIDCTLMPRNRLLVSRELAHSSMAMKMITLPVHVASPCGGALNSTMMRPTNDTSPNDRARPLIFSLNSIAPAGTKMMGVSEPMNSALATLVLVTPVKKHMMFSPNTMPGTSARRRS